MSIEALGEKRVKPLSEGGSSFDEDKEEERIESFKELFNNYES